MRCEATSQLNRPAITNRDRTSQSSWLIRARLVLNFDLEAEASTARCPRLGRTPSWLSVVDFIPCPLPFPSPDAFVRWQRWPGCSRMGVSQSFYRRVGATTLGNG